MLKKKKLINAYVSNGHMCSLISFVWEKARHHTRKKMVCLLASDVSVVISIYNNYDKYRSFLLKYNSNE